MGQGVSSDHTGMGLAYGLMLMFAYFLAACGPVLFTFLYAYVGLFQTYDIRQHKLRVAQLLLSFPTVLLGAFIAYMLFTKGSPFG